jgi:DNA-directed RNA polymerase subunit RPC12/RpoP
MYKPPIYQFDYRCGNCDSLWRRNDVFEDHDQNGRLIGECDNCGTLMLYKWPIEVKGETRLRYYYKMLKWRVEKLLP